MNCNWLQKRGSLCLMKDAEHFRIFLTILSIKFKERQENHTVLFSDANVTGKTIKKKARK